MADGLTSPSRPFALPFDRRPRPRASPCRKGFHVGSLDLGRLARVELPDDVLAHVHAVILAKLRVHEPILIGWTEPDGRYEEVLVNPSMPMVITYDLDAERRLDRRWLQRLMASANSVRGLQLRPEVVDALRSNTEEAADAGGAATGGA